MKIFILYLMVVLLGITFASGITNFGAGTPWNDNTNYSSFSGLYTNLNPNGQIMGRVREIYELENYGWRGVLTTNLLPTPLTLDFPVYNGITNDTNGGAYTSYTNVEVLLHIQEDVNYYTNSATLASTNVTCHTNWEFKTVVLDGGSTTQNVYLEAADILSVYYFFALRGNGTIWWHLWPRFLSNDTNIFVSGSYETFFSTADGGGIYPQYPPQNSLEGIWRRQYPERDIVWPFVDATDPRTEVKMGPTGSFWADSKIQPWLWNTKAYMTTSFDQEKTTNDQSATYIYDGVVYTNSYATGTVSLVLSEIHHSSGTNWAVNQIVWGWSRDSVDIWDTNTLPILRYHFNGPNTNVPTMTGIELNGQWTSKSTNAVTTFLPSISGNEWDDHDINSVDTTMTNQYRRIVGARIPYAPTNTGDWIEVVYTNAYKIARSTLLGRPIAAPQGNSQLRFPSLDGYGDPDTTPDADIFENVRVFNALILDQLYYAVAACQNRYFSYVQPSGGAPNTNQYYQTYWEWDEATSNNFTKFGFSFANAATALSNAHAATTTETRSLHGEPHGYISLSKDVGGPYRVFIKWGKNKIKLNSIGAATNYFSQVEMYYKSGIFGGWEFTNSVYDAQGSGYRYGYTSAETFSTPSTNAFASSTFYGLDLAGVPPNDPAGSPTNGQIFYEGFVMDGCFSVEELSFDY